jgi:nicotinamide mononucleotide transporter
MSFNEFVSGFLGSNTIEISAAICGFICLVLLIRGNIWNFAFGFVQVTLYVWVFYQAKLYSDAGLHVVYMALQIYGWWQWSQHLHTKATVHVETISAKHLTIFLGISVVSFLLLGTAMKQYTDASFAYADAFTTCVSLVAFFMMTRRYILNWAFWIVVDIVAIYVYLQKALYPTAILYACFLIMACVGLYAWHQQSKQQLKN